MKSLGELTSGLSGVLRGIGIDVGFVQETKRKIVCFNSADGSRTCEELPESDEIKCDKSGSCSVFLSNIESVNRVEDAAKKYGLRTFIKNENGIATKTVTGIVSRDNLENIGVALGRPMNVEESNVIRSVQAGDILPPKVCNVNPLSSSCEPYVSSRSWYYMGPLKGWVKANGFVEAVKSAIGKKNNEEAFNIKSDIESFTREGGKALVEMSGDALGETSF